MDEAVSDGEQWRQRASEAEIESRRSRGSAACSEECKTMAGEDAGSVWRHTGFVSDGLPQGLVASNATPTVELKRKEEQRKRRAVCRAEQSGVRQLGE